MAPYADFSGGVNSIAGPGSRKSGDFGYGRMACSRTGISLLEILISMFVLMIGLMGVASLFPVGGFYMARGDRFDRGNVLAQQALDEMRTRGLLRPERWLYGGYPGFTEDAPSGLPQLPHLIHPVTEPGEGWTFNLDDDKKPNVANEHDRNAPAGRAFVLDPLGVAATIEAGITQGYVFPYLDLSGSDPVGVRNLNMPPEWQARGLPEAVWPIRRITLPMRNRGAIEAMPTRAAEAVFRLRDELAVELPDDGALPAQQLWEIDSAAGMPLTRSWQGNYSWLATIAPVTTAGISALQPANQGYGSHYYEVSVAVAHKRVAEPTIESERSISAEMNVDSRELAVYHETDPEMVDAALKDLRSGEWILIAGVNATNRHFLLKWYRVLSIDEVTAHEDDETNNSHDHYRRLLTLDGPDWPRPADGTSYAEGLRAIILPGIVTVVTQTLPMEDDSLWSVQ